MACRRDTKADKEMTALSGLAKNGMHLAVARIGVGVGEATWSPCAYSLLSDYFPREKRATVLAIYASGGTLGAGLALGLGGAIVGTWNQPFPGGGGRWGSSAGRPRSSAQVPGA